MQLISCSYHDREYNKSLIFLFCFFYLLGAILGYRLFDRLFEIKLVAFQKPDLWILVKSCFISALLPIFFSTSSVGWFAVPVVFLSNGFAVSVDVAFLLRYGFSLIKTTAVIAFPNVLLLAALLFLGETAVEDSLEIRSCCVFKEDYCLLHSYKGKQASAAIITCLSALIKSRLYILLSE